MILDKIRNNRTIVKNTGYLSLIEIMRLILPLIALPYILRIVGTDKYGSIVFAQTVITYFSIFINFGLDVSAVRNISVNRSNPVRRNLIISSVLTIKLVLFLISFTVLCIGIWLFPFMHQNALLYIFCFLTCLSELLFPGWYFQGIEKMKYLTIIRFISILFYTVSIFIFVRSANDYLYVPLLQSLGNVLAGIISFVILLKVEHNKLIWPGIYSIKYYFTESIPFFFSRLSLVFNLGLAKIVSGLFFSMHLVSAFDLAQKVSLFSLVPMQMLNQAAYPHIAKTKSKSFVRHFFKLNIGLSFVVACVIFLMAPFITSFFAGDSLPESVVLMRILSIYIFCAGMTTYLGAPVLVSFGIAKGFNQSVIVSSFVLMFVYGGVYLIDFFTIYSFAFATCLTEMTVLMIRLYYCRKYQLFSGSPSE